MIGVDMLRVVLFVLLLTINHLSSILVSMNLKYNNLEGQLYLQTSFLVAP